MSSDRKRISCTKQCSVLQRREMHSNPETFKVAIQILRSRAKGSNHHRNYFCLRVPYSSNCYSQFRVVIDLFKFPPCTTMLYQKLPGIPAHLLKFYLGPTNNALAISYHCYCPRVYRQIKLRQLSLDFRSNFSLLMYESSFFRCCYCYCYYYYYY